MNRLASRSISTSTLTICLAGIRILSLIMTFVTGLWCERATATSDLALADALSTVHAVSGLLFAALVIYHVWTRRRWFADMLNEPGSWRQQASHHVIPLCGALFLSSVVSGVAIMLGCATAVAFHIGAGLMLCLVAIVHVVLTIGRLFRSVKENL